MSWLGGKKLLADENKKAKRSRIVMKKTKLPQDVKTKYFKCPACGKNGFHRRLKKCHICGFSYEPDKPLEIRKANSCNTSNRS